MFALPHLTWSESDENEEPFNCVTPVSPSNKCLFLKYFALCTKGSRNRRYKETAESPNFNDLRCQFGLALMKIGAVNLRMQLYLTASSDASSLSGLQQQVSNVFLYATTAYQDFTKGSRCYRWKCLCPPLFPCFINFYLIEKTHKHVRRSGNLASQLTSAFKRNYILQLALSTSDLYSLIGAIAPQSRELPTRCKMNLSNPFENPKSNFV